VFTLSLIDHATALMNDKAKVEDKAGIEENGI
jgi:hypothetical protein